jgi:hypothetical protein
VKAVTACRLEDICSLRSGQLDEGRVVFAASATCRSLPASAPSFLPRGARSTRGRATRKAGFPRAAEEDVPPKRAALAFDVSPEAMLKSTGTEKKRTADEVIGALHDKLAPKAEAKEGPGPFSRHAPWQTVTAGLVLRSSAGSGYPGGLVAVPPRG